MSEIQELDRNFKVHSTLTKPNVKMYDVCELPFCVYGLQPPRNMEDCFHRMPKSIAEKISAAVVSLHTNTTGGRVRFATDSTYIAIHAEMKRVTKLPHMPLTGTGGFDLYRMEQGRERYVHTFVPPQDLEMEYGYESEFYAGEGKLYEYTLNFPLYSDVKRLYIVLDHDAAVKEGSKYSNTLPVVYYGSSITQGACASRPGNIYQNIIARKYNLDYVNLAFSGNAKAEEVMAEYIASLKMCAFVYDYDYNAPDPDYLKATHERFYKIVRTAQPQLPIVCVSKPYNRDEESHQRRAVIRETVENAKAAGDQNIYFVDGDNFEKELNAGDGIVVDGCHPNDLGFLCMANLIGDKLKEALFL